MQREFNISLSQEFYSDVVYISQYDADYNIVFHVKNKYAAAIVAGLAAKFTGIRPDGLGFEFTSTGVNSDVTFAIDNTISAVAGTGTGEIVFTDANDMVFGSANVQIIVEPAAHPNDAIDADVEEEQALADEIRGMIDEVEDTVTTVTEAKNTAVAAAGNAEDAKDAAVNAKNDAQTAKTAADADALKAEGYAVGKQNGTDVASDSDYYQNNAKYYKEQAASSATSASGSATAAAGSATAAASNTAPAYSSSATYAVGDYCVYNSQLYRCTTAITTAEAWTAAHWTAVTVGGEISSLKEDLNDIFDLEFERVNVAEITLLLI